MRLELIRVGLVVELANHYTTKGTITSPACLVRLIWIVFVMDGSLEEKL